MHSTAKNTFAIGTVKLWFGTVTGDLSAIIS